MEHLEVQGLAEHQVQVDLLVVVEVQVLAEHLGLVGLQEVAVLQVQVEHLSQYQELKTQ
jgi:hypothetical protein